MLSTVSAKKFFNYERGKTDMKIDTEKLNIAVANSGMMLKDVASASGLSDVALRNIRTGKSEPKLRTIGRIANALGVGVQEIIVMKGDEE